MSEDLTTAYMLGKHDGRQATAKILAALLEALTTCRELLGEAEADEINIADEIEKWDRAYGHLISNKQ